MGLTKHRMKEPVRIAPCQDWCEVHLEETNGLDSQGWLQKAVRVHVRALFVDMGEKKTAEVQMEESLRMVGYQRRHEIYNRGMVDLPGDVTVRCQVYVGV